MQAAVEISLLLLLLPPRCHGNMLFMALLELSRLKCSFCIDLDVSIIQIIYKYCLRVVNDILDVIIVAKYAPSIF